MVDVNGLVTALMGVEKQPVNKLTAKQASYQSQLSAVGTLKSAVSSFQSSLSGLTSASSLQPMAATSSDTSILTATASTSAAAGNYTIEVSKLAQAQKLATAGQASSTAAIGGGTLSFDFGAISGGAFNPATGKYTGATFTGNGAATQTVNIAANSSLEGIRDAINAANIGVSATIVNDGSGTPYRLALSSANSGSSNSLKISVSGDAALGSLMAHNPAGTQSLTETQTAQNAQLKVDGLSISKATNTISDAISGVTLNLAKVGASPVTLSVASDSGGITKSVQTFVDGFNALNKSLNSALASGVVGSTAPLHGDSMVRNLQSQLRGILTSSVGGTTNVSTLSQIGVTFQKDGSLALDSTKLANALKNNSADVIKIFSAVSTTPANEGIATRLSKFAQGVLGADGALTTRTTSINNSIRDLGKQIDSWNTRLTAMEARYRKQYSSLDTMLSSMNTTSNFLATQLAKL
jgi:flagellar hook-associated protein 2